MSRSFLKGATDKSAYVRILDANGNPRTDVVYNTSGLAAWYRRTRGAKTAITLVTLASLTTAHSDGSFLHVGDGYYQIDLPDAAIASGADDVLIGGSLTDCSVIGELLTLADHDAASLATLVRTEMDSNSTKLADILTDTGTTLPASISAINGLDAAGVRAAVGLASANLDTQFGTLATPAQVASALSTYDAPTKAELDTAVAALATPAQVLTQATAALNSYDAPTKAEMDAALAALVLTSTERNAIATALLDLTAGVETGYTVRQVLRLIGSVNAGKVSGAGTTTNTFRNLADDKDRVVATVDTDGNRSAITLDLT